ncbi:hypothetical protein D9M71_578610 [compost metagenome]
MHGFIEPQAFHIRPVDQGKARAHASHLVRREPGLETDVLRISGRLHPLEQIRQRKAQPGYDHGPGLDAAQPVNALFQPMGFDQVLH